MPDIKLTVPKEVLGRACAANFVGDIWCVDSRWAQAAYKQLAMVGFEVAIRNAPESEAHASGGSGGAAQEKPYVMVGSVAVMGIDGPMTKHTTSLSGFLGGTSTVALRNAFRAAAKDDAVKAILLRVSSPGGSVAGTGDLADDIRAVAGMKPVVTYAEDVMASAAYWVGSQATHVMASPHADVGSIGAYMQIIDDSEADARAGIKVHTIKSTPKKAAGIPPVTSEDLKEIQKRVDAAHELFVEGILAARDVDPEKVATGQVWTAKDAMKLGLVDSVGTIDEALSVAQGLAGESELGSAVRRKRAGAAAASASNGLRSVAVTAFTTGTSATMPDISSTADAAGSAIFADTASSAPERSGTLLEGEPRFNEQAGPEPRPAEDPDMTKTGAGGVPEGAAATTAPSVPSAAAPQDASQFATKAELEELRTFAREQREKEAKAAAAALTAARKRVLSDPATKHLTAEQVAMFVQTPEAADELIASHRGARPSTHVDASGSPAADADAAPLLDITKALDEEEAKGARPRGVLFDRAKGWV